MVKRIWIVIGIILSLLVSNAFSSDLPVSNSSYLFETKNNLITIRATNVSFKKILSDLQAKAGIKTEFFGDIDDLKISLDIESHPADSINSLLKKMSLRNYSIVYDTQLKSQVIYILAEGLDIATIIKGKPVILQADFARNVQNAKQIKGSRIVSETFGKNEIPVRYVADEVLIKFHLGVTDNEVEEILKKHNLIKAGTNSSLEKIGYIKAKIPDGRDVQTVLKEVRQEYKVKVPEPNYVASILTAADPLYKDQWYIPETKFDLAWEKLSSSTNIKVAVIDSGVEKTHPDLQGKILPGYDFVNGDEDPVDDNGHGTFVSGIIVANSNKIGIKGLYDYARILPVKVIDQNGLGTYEDTAVGIVYAADQGAKVINLSIGGYGFSFLLQDAVDYALEKDCILVAAGGNDGIEQPIYPAAYPDVIGVSAIAQDNKIWSGSNSGRHIDVAAPGVNIISLDLNQNYSMATETSTSAAIVSAQAAMLVSEKTDFSGSIIQRLIFQAVRYPGGGEWDNLYGRGLVNVADSLMQDVKPFYDLAVSKIDIDSSRVDEDRKLYVTILLRNQGTLYPQKFDLKVLINGMEYSEIVSSLLNKKLITIEYLLDPLIENVEIKAQVTLDSDVHKENDVRSRLYNVQYDGQNAVWILYKQNAHTFIAGEAFAEWPNDSNHEIYNYIGPPQNLEYQQSFAIIKGSFDEDCGLDNEVGCTEIRNPFGQNRPYCNHFWDRGHLDNATPLEGALSDDRLGICTSSDTAVNRAYKYWTGGYGWDGVYDVEWDDGVGKQDEGVINLYLKGDQQSKNTAYEYLGHIVHLLTDMASPAHVLDDPHGGDLITGDDQYEEWISENDNQGVPHYRRFGDLAGNTPVDSSGANFPSVASLRDIFQQMAEIGDNFESDNADGGPNDNNDHQNSFGDVSDAECAVHQETLQPAAIRHVAALYKLFWDETHPSNNPRIDSFYSSPSAVGQGDAFVLVAEASDNDGQLTRAEFYRDTNGNGQLDISVDQMVGVDTDYNLGFAYLGYANLSPGSYLYFARVQDNDGLWSDPASTILTVSSSPAVPGSFLSINGYDWNADEEGDDDGVIEAREDVRMRVRLESSASIGSFFATLSSSQVNLDISDDREQYPAISAGDRAWPYGSGFDMYLDSASTVSVSFSLHVDYTVGGQDYYQDFTFSKTFYKNGSREASFEIVSFTIDDSVTRAAYNNGDGIIQSGERVDIRPKLKNTGQSGATNIDAWLTYSGTVLSVDGPTDTESYPDLDPGQEDYPEIDQDYTIRDIHRDYTGTQFIDFHLIYYQSQSEVILPSAIGVDIQPAAWLKVPEDTWDFGVEAPGTTVVHTTQINNDGSAPLTITSITTSNGDTTWTGITLPLVLAPGATGNIEISIDTTGLQGTISREVTIQSDGRVGRPGEDDKLIISGLVSDTIPISTIPNVTDASYPDISGNWIVWQDSRNGNLDIYAFDTASGVEQQITNDSNHQYGPFISGNLVVWEDYRNNPGTADSDIYAYDLNKPELGVFPVSAVSPWEEEVVGVADGLVAVRRVYEILNYVNNGVNRTEEVWTMHVYEYDGSGGFSEFWSTGYTPGVGENPRQHVSSRGDLNEGLLVFQQLEYFIFVQSDGDRTWQTRNQATYAIDFAAGDTSATKAFNGNSVIMSAAAHRFVYLEESTARDDEVWLWRTNGATESLVGVVDEDVDNDVLAIGGPDGKDIVVYEWRVSFRTGLMYIDRENSGQEMAITTTEGADELRADNYGLVWIDVSDSDKIRYTYLKQPDITVSAADISFSNENPIEGDAVDVSVLVRNLSDYTLADDITVRLYIGDPDVDGEQLGADQVISGGLAGNDSQTVSFVGVVIPDGAVGSDEGQIQMYIRIKIPGYDNFDNNTANGYLTVFDNDTEGPSISNVLVEEYNGDGDGVIGADEQIRISWDLTDLSGIGAVSLSVDDTPISLAGNYYAVLGPLGAGDHNFSINATDNDASPVSSQYDSSFIVVIDEKLTVLYNNSSITNASAIYVDDFPVAIPDASILFIIRNDGDQTLTLDNFIFDVTQGNFSALGPMTASLPEGSSTYFTIVPDTSSVGLFSGIISIANSDINENPFNFTISGEVYKPLLGDVDYNEITELRDAILVLQVLTGIEPSSPVYKGADVNGDGIISLAEAIYALQVVSEIRNQSAIFNQSKWSSGEIYGD